MSKKREGIRQRAARGLVSYGLNIVLQDPSVIEIAVVAGYDFVRLDCEHMLFPHHIVTEMIRTARLLEIPIQIRLDSLDHVESLMDLGVSAIMIPHVGSKEKALQAVAAIKFPPLGKRGITSAARVLGFGRISPTDYCKSEAGQVSLIVQIEDESGLANIDEILSVEGVDFVATGRNDLAQALGIPGKNAHTRVLEAENLIIRKALQHGKVPTILVKTPKRMEALRQKGVLCFSIARDDLLLMDALCGQISLLKES